jgi:predicted nucleic acid-binding protein
VSAVVILDAGPLDVLSNPKRSAPVVACRQWVAALNTGKRRVIVPEITDFEVRRELVRAKKRLGLALLDGLAQQLEYLPLSTAAMRKAAELWALARQQGKPTAPDHALDIDVILAAQALTLSVPSIVVATTNVGHLTQFVAAELWQNITP